MHVMQHISLKNITERKDIEIGKGKKPRQRGVWWRGPGRRLGEWDIDVLWDGVSLLGRLLVSLLLQKFEILRQL